MKVLITGASGFIGSNFIRLVSSFDIIEVDLLARSIAEVSFCGIDSVIHLAALVHQMKGASEEQYYKINRDLAFAVAKKAKEEGVKQFVLLSTVKVYGELNSINGYYDETSDCQPVDPYGRSKFEAEELIKSIEDDSFKVAIIRSPLVYGADVKANMLSLVKLVDRFKFLPFGGINNQRSMVYVGNLVELIKSVIEKEASGVFIAGDHSPLSTTDVIKYIAIGLNKRIYLFKFPSLVLKIFCLILPRYSSRIYGSLVISNKSTNERLQFNPPYSSEKGIFEMVRWYLKKKK